MIKLANKQKDNSISVLEMKDGDVGEIVAWGSCSSKSQYIGLIVQRRIWGNQDLLIALGAPAGKSWSNCRACLADSERVRLLEEGETLVFTKK